MGVEVGVGVVSDPLAGLAHLCILIWSVPLMASVGAFSWSLEKRRGERGKNPRGVWWEWGVLRALSVRSQRSSQFQAAHLGGDRKRKGASFSWSSASPQLLTSQVELYSHRVPTALKPSLHFAPHQRLSLRLHLPRGLGSPLCNLHGSA